jgi:hypothetical protein
METTQSDRVATRRAASIQLAEQKKAKKLHAIAERRAASRGMTKEDYIAEIVKGKYPPITAADIADEPTPQ